jgi:hypothetical protein
MCTKSLCCDVLMGITLGVDAKHIKKVLGLHQLSKIRLLLFTSTCTKSVKCETMMMLLHRNHNDSRIVGQGNAV